MNDYGIDYGGLKPGLYVQRGAAIKALDVANSTDGFNWLEIFGLKKVDDDTLASRESWTATALSRRAEQLLAVPHAWMEGKDSELDVPPFGIKESELWPQIDKALQIKEYGAFLHKVRVARKGGLSRLIWLDPDTITPDYKTATHVDGVKRFEREVKGKHDWIDAADLLWFKRPGMGELRSDPAPIEASRLDAEILYNMRRMLDSLYEGNALPIMLVMVPPATVEAERTRLQEAFDNLFNRTPGTRTVKTIAVREGVEVKALQITPNDLDLEGTEKRHGPAVLGVHHVPESVVRSAAANYATAANDRAEFAGTMATRMESIAAVFNEDADVMAAGVRLEVMREQLPVLADDVLKNAQAFSLLTDGKLDTEDAANQVGISLPDEYGEGEEIDAGVGGVLTQDMVLNGAQIRSALDIVIAFNEGVFPRDNALNALSLFFNLPVEHANAILPNTPQAGTMPEEQPRQDEIDARKSAELEKLHRYCKNGTHFARDFESDILTLREIKGITAQYEYDYLDGKTYRP